MWSDGSQPQDIYVCGDADHTGTSAPGRCERCGSAIVYEPAGVASGAALVCAPCAMRLMGITAV
jgi:hypothetical protein